MSETRRSTRTTVLAVVALACAATVGAGLLTGGEGGHQTSVPVVTPTPLATPADAAAPSPREWHSDAVADRTTLYLATHRCPRPLVAGRCAVTAPLPDRRKALPLVLWRYEEGRWQRLGSPGATSLARLESLPGGVLLVPQQLSRERIPYPHGPLRVSADRGETWVDWALPWPDRTCGSTYDRSCQVAVAGDHVVVASATTWARRSLGSPGWETITPPRREPLYAGDDRRYGLLALDDGTLVATANDSRNPEPRGFYRVSRDSGSTWSAPRRTPGRANAQLYLADGPNVHASCVKIYRVGGGISGNACGAYWTRDLVRWKRVEVGSEPIPAACTGSTQPTWDRARYREPDSEPQRIGDAVYAVDTRTVDPASEPVMVRSVLQVSTDGCRSWVSALD